MHTATLRSGNHDVVVKVQKPGVASVLKADLGFLASVTGVMELLLPELEKLSVKDVVTDLRMSMLMELDFKQEAKVITGTDNC